MLTIKFKVQNKDIYSFEFIYDAKNINEDIKARVSIPDHNFALYTKKFKIKKLSNTNDFIKFYIIIDSDEVDKINKLYIDNIESLYPKQNPSIKGFIAIAQENFTSIDSNKFKNSANQKSSSFGIRS